MYRKMGVFVFFIFLIYSWKAYGENKLSDPNIETALVAFYGVFFLEDHDPTSFYNTEDPENRYTIDEFILASSGSPLESLIKQSIKSMSSERSSKGYLLVHFSVPGGKIYYACHSHGYSYQASDNHCTACIGDGSIEIIQLSDELKFSIEHNCPIVAQEFR